jgi:hypothetical protein
MLCKAAAHDHGTVDFDGFPPELKDILYEYMHLQVIKEASHQLKYRYNPAPSCLQKVSKKFAEASNKRIPHGQIRNFEITQRNLVFLPAEQQFFFTKSQAGSWTDSTHLTLNFTINDGTLDGKFEDALIDLLCWICSIIDKWHNRRGGNTPRVESDVTVRFWLCSMEAYDKFYPLINREWELIDGIVFGDRARIETRFYERKDHKPFPNKACAADAKVIEVWTEATWWQVDYPGLALAREMSNLHWYREVEQETNPWCLMYLDEGMHGESDDSEEEGSSEDKSEESEDPAEVSFEGSNASKAKTPEENEDADEESF